MKMEKIGHVFLPLALAGALALGCAPAAFAEDGDFSYDTDTGNTASTNVNVQTDSHLSARVPMALSVSASIDGGAIQPPTDGAYGITNLSYFDIKVSEVKAAAAAKWEYSDIALSSTSALPTDINKTGFINLVLTPAGETEGTMLTSAVQNLDWTIGAASDNTGETLTIAVSGTTSPLRTILNTPEDAATIIYKIVSA